MSQHAGIASPSKLSLLVRCQHWPRLVIDPYYQKAVDRWDFNKWNEEWNKAAPDTSNKYTLEGQKAHRLLEMLAESSLLATGRERTEAEYDEFEGYYATLAPRTIQNVEFAIDFLVEYMMMHRVQPANIWLERRVRWSPRVWGTADITMWHDGILNVMDFKNGSGVAVDAVNSFQLAAYGGGAFHTIKHPVDKIHLWIIQPSHPTDKRIQKWETDLVDIFDMMQEVDEVCDNLGSNPVAGPHCDSYFCPARKICDAYLEQSADPDTDDFKDNIAAYREALRKLK